MFLSDEMLLLLTLFLCFCLAKCCYCQLCFCVFAWRNVALVNSVSVFLFGKFAIVSSVSVFLFGEMLLLIALFLCFCLAKCCY